MSGLPTLLVELDDAASSGSFPYDITPYVDLRAGWSLTRGRQDELGEVDPAQARLTLDNRDGRFTLGSAQYGIVVDQRIRITETFAGTTSRRVTGYVQDWPVSFTDPGARLVPCPVTVVDRQSRLARRRLVGIADAYRVDGPSFTYLLDETPAANGATSFGDTSGQLRKPLTSSGNGSAFTPGSPVVADIVGVNFTGGKRLATKLPNIPVQTLEAVVLAPEVPASYQVIVAVVNQAPMNGGSTFFRLGISDTGRAFVQADIAGNPNGGTQLDGPVIAGGPHHIAAGWQPGGNGGRLSLYVDGVFITDAPTLAPPAGFTDLAVAAGTFIPLAANFVGTVAAIAGYPGQIPDQRITAHSAYVTGVERSDSRVARIAALAGIGSSELLLEQGFANVGAQSLSGQSVSAALSDVATTEGGTLFFRGDGKLVMQNRRHRTLAATQAPSVALESADVDHDNFTITVDKQYLQNEVTASRMDGAQQTARNDTSVAMYEQYPADLPSLLVTTDDEVADRANWQVNTYGQPRPRLNSVTIDLFTLQDAAKVKALLSLEMGDRLTISGLPVQSPIATADLIVEGSNEQQSTEAWSLELNTVSADLFRAWVLGSPTYGVLDSTTRLAY